MVGAIVSGVASLASGVMSAIGANRRRRKAEQIMQERKEQLESWRDAELGTSSLDRADARNAMRRIFEYNKDVQRAADASAIKRGMTDEAKVAQAGRLNRNVAAAASELAAAGEAHKDRVKEQVRRETAELDNLKVRNLMDSSGAENLVQGVTSAATGLGSALSMKSPAVSGNAGGVPVSATLKTMASSGEGVKPISDTRAWMAGLMKEWREKNR